MRLTIINQFYKPDLAPTGHLAASLAEHRFGLGDDVTVITSLGGYVPGSPIESSLASISLRIVRLWTPRLGKERGITRIVDYAFFYIQAALRMLFLPPQDVIVSLTTPPFIAWVGLIHKFIHPSAKLVLWNMDSYPEILVSTGVLSEKSPLARFFRRLNTALFKKLDYLVCLDDAMCQMLSSHYLPEDSTLPAEVIPNWEPWDQFPRDLSPRFWPGARNLELADNFVVLYLGNAGFGHRFETVLEGARRMLDRPVKFLFVGGGNKWQELQDRKESLGLRNLILLPYVPKGTTPEIMALSHCSLITLNESALGIISPSKLHSSLAMGLPVVYVGPEGGNVDQAIRRFDCGASVRHGGVEQFVDFIESLRTNKELLSEYGRNARSAFEQAYNDRVTLPKFDEIIDALGRSGG